MQQQGPKLCVSLACQTFHAGHYQLEIIGRHLYSLIDNPGQNGMTYKTIASHDQVYKNLTWGVYKQWTGFFVSIF